MTKKHARGLVGGLSNPSKMPGYAWSTPASRCPLGAKLAKQSGTICSICYARKGFYGFSNVQAALEKRWRLLMEALDCPDKAERFRAAFRRLLDGEEYFRWHDSGDLQDERHLRVIIDIAHENPDTKFWLPTRQIDFLTAYRASGGDWPTNLTVRISGTKIGGPAPVAIARRLGIQVSSVDATDAYICPAPTQGNNCGDCRACWDPNVFNVSYHAH